MLKIAPREVDVKGMTVGYGLVGEGIIITDKYLSVILDGTVH